MSLGLKNFSDLVYNKLLELDDEVILINPTTASNFPCREMGTPIKSVSKTYPVDTFQISIKHWNSKLNEAMEMSDKTDEKLLEYNFVRINTSTYIYDETLKEYAILSIYEVKYNALTNAFQVIK